MGNESFSVEEYRAIAQEISDKIIEYQHQLVQKLMPKSHQTLDTFYYVSLQVMTKSICTICLNNMDAREKAMNDMLETIPRLVRDARVIHTKDVPRNSQ